MKWFSKPRPVPPEGENQALTVLKALAAGTSRSVRRRGRNQKHSGLYISFKTDVLLLGPLAFWQESSPLSLIPAFHEVFPSSHFGGGCRVPAGFQPFVCWFKGGCGVRVLITSSHHPNQNGLAGHRERAGLTRQPRWMVQKKKQSSLRKERL